MPLFLTSDVLVEILSVSDLRSLPASDPGNGYPYLMPDGTLRVDSGSPTLPGPTVLAGKFWMTDGLGGTVYGEPALLDAAAIEAALDYVPADDSLVVHKAGSETITGAKTFSDLLTTRDASYEAIRFGTSGYGMGGNWGSRLNFTYGNGGGLMLGVSPSYLWTAGYLALGGAFGGAPDNRLTSVSSGVVKLTDNNLTLGTLQVSKIDLPNGGGVFLGAADILVPYQGDTYLKATGNVYLQSQNIYAQAVFHAQYGVYATEVRASIGGIWSDHAASGTSVRMLAGSGQALLISPDGVPWTFWKSDFSAKQGIVAGAATFSGNVTLPTDGRILRSGDANHYIELNGGGQTVINAPNHFPGYAALTLANPYNGTVFQIDRDGLVTAGAATFSSNVSVGNGTPGNQTLTINGWADPGILFTPQANSSLRWFVVGHSAGFDIQRYNASSYVSSPISISTTDAVTFSGDVQLGTVAPSSPNRKLTITGYDGAELQFSTHGGFGRARIVSTYSDAFAFHQDGDNTTSLNAAFYDNAIVSIFSTDASRGLYLSPSHTATGVHLSSVTNYSGLNVRAKYGIAGGDYVDFGLRPDSTYGAMGTQSNHPLVLQQNGVEQVRITSTQVTLAGNMLGPSNFQIRAATYLDMNIGGATILGIASTSLDVAGTLRPSTDLGQDLGQNDRRWNDVHAARLKVYESGGQPGMMMNRWISGSSYAGSAIYHTLVGGVYDALVFGVSGDDGSSSYTIPTDASQRKMILRKRGTLELAGDALLSGRATGVAGEVQYLNLGGLVNVKSVWSNTEISITNGIDLYHNGGFRVVPVSDSPTLSLIPYSNSQDAIQVFNYPSMTFAVTGAGDVTAGAATFSSLVRAAGWDSSTWDGVNQVKIGASSAALIFLDSPTSAKRWAIDNAGASDGLRIWNGSTAYSNLTTVGLAITGSITSTTYIAAPQFYADAAAPCYSWSESGVAWRGAMGFTTGSTTLEYRPGAQTMASGTTMFSITSTGTVAASGVFRAVNGDYAGFSHTSSRTGNTGNIQFVNASNYGYGKIGVVSGTGLIGGDVFGLGYNADNNSTFTPVIKWSSAGVTTVGVTYGTVTINGGVYVNNAVGTHPAGPTVLNYNETAQNYIRGSANSIEGPSTFYSNVTLGTGTLLTGKTAYFTGDDYDPDMSVRIRTVTNNPSTSVGCGIEVGSYAGHVTSIGYNNSLGFDIYSNYSEYLRMRYEVWIRSAMAYGMTLFTDTGLKIKDYAGTSDAPITASAATFSGAVNVTASAQSKITATTSGYTPAFWVSDANSTLGGAMYFEWRGAGVGQKVKAFIADSNGLGFYRMADGGGSFVDSTPDLVIGNANGLVGIRSTLQIGQLNVQPRSTTTLGIYVKGIASQTAALLQLDNSADVSMFKVTAAGVASAVGFTCPTGGTVYAEKFGAGSTASDYGTTVGALSIGAANSVAIGYGITTIYESTAVGALAYGGWRGVALGYGANTTSHYGVNDGIAIGNGANCTHYQSIVINSASTVANQFITGSAAAPITNRTINGNGGTITIARDGGTVMTWDSAAKATFANDLQLGYASATPSARWQMAAAGTRVGAVGNGSGTWQTAIQETYVASAAAKVETSIAQLSGDPTTSDVAAGFHLRVKNTTTGEISDWINDGGVMKRATSYSAVSTGWSATGHTPTKTFDASTATLADVSDVLGTLLTRLIDAGAISA